VKQLNCTEPFIVFSKNPSNFTSKYKSAPMFTSKECKIEKVFGEPIKKVLYVFDGSQQIDLNALTANVLSEIRTLVGGVVGPAHTQLATQLQKFMSSMVSLPQHLLAPKLSMPNLFTTSTTGMPVVMAQPKATQATQR